VYGQISKKYFEHLGLGRKPMFLAQNSVHTERFIEQFTEHADSGRKLRQKLGIQDRFVFSYFGKLTARKKVDSIIDAFRIVSNMQPTACLLIAGTGPDKQRLEALAADLVEEGHLIFMGRVPNGEEGPLLHAMDAYLSFSQGGLGILEAMATARTIISTPEVFPETELLKGGMNCLLSEDFSTTAFATAMEKAIREPEQSRTMGLKAQQTVKEKAGTNVMVNAFLNAIRHTFNQ
jgi:glycosyltransferase involved in cell wall biosynthesis